MGFVKPHSYDKSYWQSPGFHISRFQVSFSRKENFLIDYRSEGDVTGNIELAYAISVHKSQGSDFEYVYFIVPKNKKGILSKELFYTGITRARKKLVLFVEKDISPLLSYMRSEKSQLLGINSSVFSFEPIPDDLFTMKGWYEEGKIHRTLSDHMVRSKSEVIIANMLSEREIPFKYEIPAYAEDGTFYLPDFVITWNGETWYWEHLGRMDLPKYKNHWETKKKWYKKYFPGKLITTQESGNLSGDAQDLIKKYFS